MCTRLHAIGFPCEIDHATAKTIAGISDNPTKRVTCAGGEYRIWRGGSGAEIWLHCPSVPAAATPAPPVKTPATFPLANTNPLDGVDPVRGMTIFHRGASDITVKLDRSMALSKQNPLDGVCLAYLDDRNGKGRPAPFVFEQLGFAADRFTEGHLPFPGAVLFDQYPQSHLAHIAMTQLRAIEGAQDELAERDQQHFPAGDRGGEREPLGHRFQVRPWSDQGVVVGAGEFPDAATIRSESRLHRADRQIRDLAECAESESFQPGDERGGKGQPTGWDGGERLPGGIFRDDAS